MFKNMGGNIPGGNFLGGNFPGGTLMGGNFPSGSFPDIRQKNFELKEMLNIILKIEI